MVGKREAERVYRKKGRKKINSIKTIGKGNIKPKKTRRLTRDNFNKKNKQTIKQKPF